MPDTGTLRHHGMIWELSAVPDAAGHIDETDDTNWAEVGARYCEIIPKGSREFFRGQQVAEQITHQITFRFDAQSKDFHAAMRFERHDGRRFNFAGPGVNTGEADEWLVFPAIEVRP